MKYVGKSDSLDTFFYFLSLDSLGLEPKQYITSCEYIIAKKIPVSILTPSCQEVLSESDTWPKNEVVWFNHGDVDIIIQWNQLASEVVEQRSAHI